MTATTNATNAPAIASASNPLGLAATEAQTFHFRSIPKDTAAQTKAQAADLAAHAADFEDFTAKVRNKAGGVDEIPSYKRKSVECTVTYPGFLLTLSDPALQALVKNAVDRFVKSTYIDEFLPVGAHDWETVSAGIVSAFLNTASKGGNTPDDELLEQAQAVWSQVIAQLSPALAQYSGEWIAKGCTDAAIRKTLVNDVTKLRLERIAARVQQVIGVASDPENAAVAHTIPALKYAADRVAAMLGKMGELSDDAL